MDSKRSFGRLLLVLKSTCPALAVWAILLFDLFPLSHGIRTTADEVGLLFHLFDGWELVGRVASSLASHQGRISAISFVLQNTLSASLADSQAWRVGFAALHLSTYAMFGLYVSRLFRLELSPLIVVTALSLHPVSGGFMPPMAYPLQNEPSLLVVLMARWLLLAGAAPSRRALNGLLYVLLLVVLVASEYALLFATALIAAEWSLACATEHAGERLSHRVATLMKTTRFRADLVCVLLAAGVHVSFRLMHPSQYDGNSLDKLGTAGDMTVTAIHHILAGTSFPYFSLQVLNVPGVIIFVATIVGAATAYVASRSVRNLSSIPHPGWVCVVAFGLMLYVTLPIAATSKYQDWCLRGSVCAYLDSRIAYFGVPVFVLSGLALGLKAVRARAGATMAVAALIGGVAFLTYCLNWQLSSLAMTRSAPWQRANELACAVAIPADVDLASTIDPQTFVSFHPDLDRPLFWRRYLAWKREQGACDHQRGGAR